MFSGRRYTEWRMKDISSSNFGLLIAYLVPGFVALWGASYFSETVRGWLTPSYLAAPTVGGFLYATVGAVAAGLTVSTVRWLVIDTIHHRTGIARPQRDSAVLNDYNVFQLAVSNQYRYYQFYGNMIVAVPFSYLAYAATHGWPGLLPTVALGAVLALFWLGSRDTLRNYADRLVAMQRISMRERTR